MAFSAIRRKPFSENSTGDAVGTKSVFVLPNDGAFRMFQNIEQVVHREFIADDMYGESSDEFRFKTEVDEIFRCDVLKGQCVVVIGLTSDFSVEPDSALMHAFFNYFFDTGKRRH